MKTRGLSPARKAGASLVIRPEKMGDLVVSTAVFRSLRESFPQSEVHLLTDEVTANLVESDPYLDEIITVPWKGLGRESRLGLRGIVKLVRDHGPYDRAIILYPGWSGWNWVAFRNLIPKVAQIGGTVGAICFGHTMVLRKNYKSGQHASERYLEVASKVGAKAEDAQPRLYVSQEEVWRVKDRFPSLNEPKKLFVHPFGVTASGNLGLPSYLKICEMIVQRSDYHVFLLGTADEIKRFPRIEHPRIHFELGGGLSIRELMAACTLADAVIGGASGIGHISAALGRPTLGLYCPFSNHVQTWGPRGEWAKTLKVPDDLCRRITGKPSGCQAPAFCDYSFALNSEMIWEGLQNLMKEYDRGRSTNL